MRHRCSGVSSRNAAAIVLRVMSGVRLAGMRSRKRRLKTGAGDSGQVVQPKYLAESWEDHVFSSFKPALVYLKYVVYAYKGGHIEMLGRIIRYPYKSAQTAKTDPPEGLFWPYMPLERSGAPVRGIHDNIL